MAGNEGDDHGLRIAEVHDKLPLDTQTKLRDCIKKHENCKKEQIKLMSKTALKKQLKHNIHGELIESVTLELNSYNIPQEIIGYGTLFAVECSQPHTSRP